MFRAVDVQLLPSNPSVDAHELTCAENARASIIDTSKDGVYGCSHSCRSGGVTLVVKPNRFDLKLKWKYILPFGRK